MSAIYNICVKRLCIRTHLQKPWQDKRFLCNLALKVLAVERLVSGQEQE